MDYVEARLLVAWGWRVEMDPRITGSFEEGPDNLLAFARRIVGGLPSNLRICRLVVPRVCMAGGRFVFIKVFTAYLVSRRMGAVPNRIAAGRATKRKPLINSPMPIKLFRFPRRQDLRFFFWGRWPLQWRAAVCLPKLAIFGRQLLQRGAHGALAARGVRLASGVAEILPHRADRADHLLMYRKPRP